MERISNEQKMIELTNDLLRDCDSVRELGNYIDEAVFDCIYLMVSRNESLIKEDENKLYILRKIRDLFWSLETENVKRELRQP
jgi:hypothetical protein